MTAGQNGLNRLGGISFVASGTLFLVKSVLDLLTGPPPATGAEILAWRDSHHGLLVTVNEVFFFAFMFLVPAVIALYASLRARRSHAALGCGILAATIPVLAVLAVVHGRLVFPMFRIQVHTPDQAELVVAIYYAGLHAVAELLAVATFVLSLAMRRGAHGRPIAYLGFATAVADAASAYPEAIGPALGLVCGVLFASWFVALGLNLCWMPADAPA